MRGLIPGLENPTPMRLAMPALFQEDGFTNRFVSAFDDALAPVLTTLDCIDAYLDPALTPPDFLPWLAAWVGIELDENWSEAQQRRLIGSAVALASWRGTRRGLVGLLSAYAGVPEDAIEVEDSGGVAHAQSANSPVPGSSTPTLVVRIRATDDGIDVTRVERLVALAKPAHLPHDVEVVPA